jgi:hypothetical protein
MKSRALIWLLATIAAAGGCNPRVTVRKDPGPHNAGIRYYRPKPYLLIEPVGAAVTVADENKKPVSTTIPSDEFVSISLDYLPDFSEEYAITVRPGLGVANVSFKLEDGWNLTEMNQELDSQFNENVSAIADLVKAGGSLIQPTSEGAGQPAQMDKRWVVRATNVPIGYYEAVINGDPNCRKRLYGWRYVGFAPFNSCPTDMLGVEAAACDDPFGPIYGLVFENGAMTFKQLNAIAPNLERVAVPTGRITEQFGQSPTGAPPLDQLISIAVEQLEAVRALHPTQPPIVLIQQNNIEITIHTREPDRNNSYIAAQDQAQRTAVQVAVSQGQTGMQARARVVQMLDR